jgi:hypothetical protein
MKTLLSYCTARAFMMAFLPMAALTARQAPAENDNDPLLPFPGVWTQRAKRRAVSSSSAFIKETFGSLSCDVRH